LIFPSSLGAPSPDGRWLFTQRGNIGIEVFDAKTLARLPRIDAPGLYKLRPSPDSRWLFGITNSQRGHGPALDIFDIENKVMVRRLPIPNGHGHFPEGSWLGDQFFLYDNRGGQGKLWKVTPETTVLDAPLKITLPNSFLGNGIVHHTLIAGGKHLFLYEGFGHKLARDITQDIPGGIFSIEPSSGKIVGHFASSVHFARVIAAKDGQFLYGIDSDRTGGSVRLLKLDASNGAVVAERAIERDVWFISLANLPVTAIPQGEVQPESCESR
jgi:hypothetical protein